jgi:hypothetical protein
MVQEIQSYLQVKNDKKSGNWRNSSLCVFVAGFAADEV